MDTGFCGLLFKNLDISMPRGSVMVGCHSFHNANGFLFYASKIKSTFSLVSQGSLLQN